MSSVLVVCLLPMHGVLLGAFAVQVTRDACSSMFGSCSPCFEDSGPCFESFMYLCVAIASMLPLCYCLCPKSLMSCLLCEVVIILQNSAMGEVGSSLSSACLQAKANTAWLHTQYHLTVCCGEGWGLSSTSTESLRCETSTKENLTPGPL